MSISNSSKNRLVTKAYGLSDLGRRKNNEDSFLIDTANGLFIVADGMGGLAKGEYASSYVSQKMAQIIKDLKHTEELTLTDDDIDLSEDPIKDLLYGIHEVNFSLHKEAIESKDEEVISHGMGTTLALLHISSNQAYILNVGDSRVYRICENSIQQITHDHSAPEEKRRWGEITAEEAKALPKNHLRRTVGTKEEVQPDFYTLTTYPPERFLLCSDGLSNMVDSKELLEFAQIPQLQTACEKMVGLAKDRGGKDNITAVLIEISEINSGQKVPEDVKANIEETLDI